MKFKYLDGLRGLAALIVVIDHFAISFFNGATDGSVQIRHGGAESIIERTPLHLFVSGNFAVCIFFVLSGFVLSAKFFRTGEKRAVVASAGKRYLRLALPVIGSVMLAYLLLALNGFYNTQAAQLTGSGWLGSFWQFNPSFFDALYHATIGVFIHGQSGYNTVLWTMKTELIGSFLVFGFLLALGRARLRWVAYLVLALALIKTYYLAFIFGMAICDYRYSDLHLAKLPKRKEFWIALTVISLVLGSSPVGTLQGTIFQSLQGILPLGLSVTTTTHLLGAFGLMVAVLYTQTLQRLLMIRPVLYLGKISFGLYLTHFLVIGSLSSYLFVKIAPAVGYRTGFAIMAVISGLAIWLVADIFTRIVDQPAIRLSAAVYNRFLRPRAASFATSTRRLVGQAA